MRLSRWLVVASAALVAAACDSAPNTAPSLDSTTRGAGGLVFATNSSPYGASLTVWTERSWQWLFGIPAAVNPGLDLTGADCAEGQSPNGPVWYLAPSFGQPSVTRTCTVPAHRALALNLSGVLNDFPCPDPNFKPAPGQSLQDFLTQGAQQIVNGVNGLTLTVDGEAVPAPLSFRFTTPLFDFTGDPSLAAALDPCITGSSQPAVADGYFVIIKPLQAGRHTIVTTASDVAGNHPVLTYDLTVEGD